jgi:ketosteroid isomerase-like protein
VLLILVLPLSCAAQDSPSETTLALYDAANKGDLEELESYYSEDLAAAMDGPVGQMTGGTAGFADHLARGGIIEDVRVASVQESGDTAHVRLEVRYAAAALAQRNAGEAFGEPNPAAQGLPLVREDGAWKVAASYLSEGG